VKVGSHRGDFASTNKEVAVASASKNTSTESIDVKTLLATYASWLDRQPLADRSRDAYRSQVVAFVEWLATSEHGADALSTSSVRDWAVRDFKRFVKAKKWKPSSVNQALAAVDNFYRSLGVGRPDVAREELAQLAPRALDADEQRRFLRAVEQSPSSRDRAIAVTFFYTGLRLSELADLTVDDVAVSARGPGNNGTGSSGRRAHRFGITLGHVIARAEQRSWGDLGDQPGFGPPRGYRATQEMRRLPPAGRHGNLPTLDHSVSARSHTTTSGRARTVRAPRPSAIQNDELCRLDS
jgi:integrase